VTTYPHQQAHVVCNHCGSVFTRPPLATDDSASGTTFVCPFCRVDPNIPHIEKGGWRESSQELPDPEGVH